VATKDPKVKKHPSTARAAADKTTGASTKDAAKATPVTITKRTIKTPATSRRRLRIKLWVPRPVRAMGAYFAGAWRELRAVRWPNRKATWELTFAVLIFSLFFALLILGLDAAFHYMFKEILS
jgi:preprotein translocase SecE subunit